MENQEIYNFTGAGRHEIVHREGVTEKPERDIIISGTISSPSVYLKKRVKTINCSDSFIEVDREKMKITLFIEATNPYRKHEISGSLLHHPDFLKWGINCGTEWNNDKLAEFIKMNRSNFESKTTAMSLSLELKEFKMNVEKELEAMNDNRGNVKAVAVQKVKETNIPESFTLKVPVFKAQQPETINVELYINASTFGITLVSPDANDIINDVRDRIIDAEKEKLSALSEAIPIIEV